MDNQDEFFVDGQDKNPQNSTNANSIDLTTKNMTLNPIIEVNGQTLQDTQADTQLANNNVDNLIGELNCYNSDKSSYIEVYQEQNPTSYVIC